MLMEEIKKEACNYNDKVLEKSDELIKDIYFITAGTYIGLKNLFKQRSIFSRTICFNNMEIKIREAKIFLKFCEEANSECPNLFALLRIYNKLSNEFKLQNIELDKIMDEVWVLTEFYNTITIY